MRIKEIDNIHIASELHGACVACDYWESMGQFLPCIITIGCFSVPNYGHMNLMTSRIYDLRVCHEPVS